MSTDMSEGPEKSEVSDSPSKKRFEKQKALHERVVYQNERNFARFLLFSFARNPKYRPKQAQGQIRSIDPKGNIATINLSVDSKNGLPGAFSQDLLTVLIDTWVTQNDVPLAKEGGTIETCLVPLRDQKQLATLSKSCFVYSQKKDLMLQMGRHEKKSGQITHALKELQDARITFKGCYYKIDNGRTEVEAITHSTNYIQSFSERERWADGNHEFECLRVQLDPVVISNLLNGYIASINRNTWLKLSAGAPRKLYSLIAALEPVPGTRNVLVTLDELMLVLQIRDSRPNRLLKKYFAELKEMGVIDDWVYTSHKGVPSVMFVLAEEHKQLPESERPMTVEQTAKHAWDELTRAIRLPEYPIRNVPKTALEIDIDEKVLGRLMKFNPKMEEYEGRQYPLAVLALESVVHKQLLKKNVRSAKAIVTSVLNGKNALDFEAGFKPSHQILLEHEASQVAKRAAETEALKRQEEDAQFQRHATSRWDTLTRADQDRLVDCVKKANDIEIQEESGQAPQPGFQFSTPRPVLESSARKVIGLAIKHGKNISSVADLTKWFLTEGRHLSEVDTQDN